MFFRIVSSLLFFTAVVFNVSPVWSQKAELVEIPDAKFLAYLKEKIPDAFTSDRMNIRSESVTSLTRINVINKKIQSFQGIEYFAALEEFNCTYNLATELNLSKNKKLKYLVCWENRLTALDFSANTELTILNCGDNKITTLNVSGNKLLRELYCEYNALTSLNLKNNKDLQILNCVNNKITRLDLGTNERLENLENAGNPIVQVDKNNILAEIEDKNFRKALKDLIPNAFVGEYLNIRHNNVVYLKTLDVSSKGIKSLKGIEYFISLEELNCHGNEIVEINLSKNTKMTNLNFEGNAIRILDIRGMRSISRISDFSESDKLSALKVHVKLRDNTKIFDLKQKKGKALKISVYSAAANSTDYILINSDDIPSSLDNRYRNNS